MDICMTETLALKILSLIVRSEVSKIPPPGLKIILNAASC